MYKSPFIVIENILSPLECEDIIERANFNAVQYREDGSINKATKKLPLCDIRLKDAIARVAQAAEGHYGYDYYGMRTLTYEWFCEGYRASKPQSDNTHEFSGKRANNIDFTGIIFLNDYSDDMNIDPRYECRGGKLEFSTHGFSINPKRGTLVYFPSCPNFLHTTTDVDIGELHQVRAHIVCQEPYDYRMSEFPGDYTEWF